MTTLMSTKQISLECIHIIKDDPLDYSLVRPLPTSYLHAAPMLFSTRFVFISYGSNGNPFTKSTSYQARFSQGSISSQGIGRSAIVISVIRPGDKKNQLTGIAQSQWHN